jgi:glycosyltransferase involved in cell wall biosynthesis
MRVLGPHAAKIDAIPLAGGRVDPSEAAVREGDLILTVGNRMPHKNVESLVEAVAAIPPDRRPRLAITGGAEGDPIRLLAARRGVTDDVDFVGWVSNAELERLYARAAIVAVPSRFEGFGLPVLEAMERGAAVVCSDIPPLREVAADAAVFVPPMDVSGWASSLMRLVDDPRARDALADAGRRRAADFSWERTAQGTLAVFQRVLEAA